MHYQKRDVDNSLDSKKKEDPVDYQTCGTKEEQEDEEEIICEPKVEECEREEEERKRKEREEQRNGN